MSESFIELAEAGAGEDELVTAWEDAVVHNHAGRPYRIRKLIAATADSSRARVELAMTYWHKCGGPLPGDLWPEVMDRLDVGESMEVFERISSECDTSEYLSRIVKIMNLPAHIRAMVALAE